MEAQEKSERLMEVAHAVLSVAPGQRLKAVVLNKVMFYLDLVSLRDNGETMTGNTYIALPQGPVVARYQKRLIEQLEALGIAQQIDEWDGSRPVILTGRELLYRHLESASLEQIKKVVEYFAGRTSAEVSEFSHENPGWDQAWAEYRRTGRPCPINMRIAMQQILEDDPWMDQPIIGEDDLLAAADAGEGDDW